MDRNTCHDRKPRVPLQLLCWSSRSLDSARVRDAELEQALGWGLAIEGEMRPSVIVLVFPFLKLLHELGRGAEGRPSIERSSLRAPSPRLARSDQGELLARTVGYRRDHAVPLPVTSDPCKRKGFPEVAEQGYPKIVRDMKLSRLCAIQSGKQNTKIPHRAGPLSPLLPASCRPRCRGPRYWRYCEFMNHIIWSHSFLVWFSLKIPIAQRILVQQSGIVAVKL